VAPQFPRFVPVRDTVEDAVDKILPCPPFTKEGVKGKTGEQTVSNFIIEICGNHNSVMP
jgi:hypothetical protein